MDGTTGTAGGGMELPLDDVSLADAMRITGRPDSTIKGWIAASNSLPPGEPRPGRYFQPGEVRVVDAVQGSGQPYRIQVAALRRVHFARGGHDWHPQAAQAHRRASPEILRELVELRQRVRDMEGRLKDAERQASYWRSQAAAATRVAVGGRGAGPGDMDDGDLGDLADDGGVVAAEGGVPVPLPATLVSVMGVAKAHGFTNPGDHSLWRGNRSFKPYVLRGAWLRGNVKVSNALDTDGQAAFGRYVGVSKHFAPCGRVGCITCQAAVDAGHLAPGRLPRPASSEAVPVLAGDGWNDE